MSFACSCGRLSWHGIHITSMYDPWYNRDVPKGMSEWLTASTFTTFQQGEGGGNLSILDKSRRTKCLKVLPGANDDWIQADRIMRKKGRHRFHGAPKRFEVVAEFIYDSYGRDIQYIADVAGGQGMLSRILRKKYNYDCEVVDPRGWTLKGVPAQAAELNPSLAGFYDLIVGLHPDEATRAVAEAALVRPAILIPCCNFWSEEKLGRDELVEAIAIFYREHGVRYELVPFDFKGPKNVGLVSVPPEK